MPGCHHPITFSPKKEDQDELFIKYLEKVCYHDYNYLYMICESNQARTRLFDLRQALEAAIEKIKELKK